MSPFIHAIGMITLVCLFGYLFAKIVTTVGDWWLDYLGRRRADKIAIGSRWRSKRSDPWSEHRYCVIIDKENGWLRYHHEDSDYLWSAKALWWKDSWEQVE